MQKSMSTPSKNHEKSK